MIVENFSPRARAIPPHLRRSLEKQLLASAILADSYVKDPKVLFVTRWQPLLKRFAGDHSYQLLYTPFQILLRCFTAIVVATVRYVAAWLVLRVLLPVCCYAGAVLGTAWANVVRMLLLRVVLRVLLLRSGTGAVLVCYGSGTGAVRVEMVLRRGYRRLRTESGL